jgi:hypothetical protein
VHRAQRRRYVITETGMAGVEQWLVGEPLTVLLADLSIYRLEADLRWIDHTAARLDLLSRAVQQ